MNEIQLAIVKKYEFIKPVVHKTDSIIDKSYRDCHNKNYHSIGYESEYDNQLTKIRSDEMVSLTIADKSMSFYEINKKLTVARQRSYIFNQILKLTMKIFSILWILIFSYFLKHRIPMCLRLFFKRLSQNKEYLENFYND